MSNFDTKAGYFLKKANKNIIKESIIFRIFAAYKRENMNTATPQTVPTFESVWAYLQENAQLQRESRADFDERMKKQERVNETFLARSLTK